MCHAAACLRAGFSYGGLAALAAGVREAWLRCSRVTSAPFRSCLLAYLIHNSHHRVHHSQRLDSIVQGKLRRLTRWAPVRFLRILSENYDRTEEGSKAVEKPEDGVEVLGGGEGKGREGGEQGLRRGRRGGCRGRGGGGGGRGWRRPLPAYGGSPLMTCHSIFPTSQPTPRDGAPSLRAATPGELF